MAGRQVTWWGPNGAAPVTLNDRGAGMRLAKGATGVWTPPVQFGTDTTPLMDGEIITDVWETGQTAQLPMMLFGADRSEFRSRMRTLARAMDPRGDGRLVIAEADGSSRVRTARYAGGLEGAEDAASGGDTNWARFGLRLYSPDPYWYEPAPRVVRYDFDTGGDPFFPISFPDHPLRVSSTSVLGEQLVSNPGDVDTWPSWEVHGPGTAMLFTNSRGDSLSLAGTLSEDRALLISTRPGEASIMLDDGTDWWDKLVGTPNLWRLPPGDTTVDMQVTGAAEGTYVALSYTPRYRGPW